MNDKRSSSFRYGVHFKEQDIWIEQGLKIEDSHRNKVLPLCFDKMVKAIAHHFLHDDRDRKYYADSYSCRPPPLFILIITLIEVSVIMFDILKLIAKYNMSSIFYSLICLSNYINILYMTYSLLVYSIYCLSINSYYSVNNCESTPKIGLKSDISIINGLQIHSN
jgi:hypothetical protein